MSERQRTARLRERLTKIAMDASKVLLTGAALGGGSYAFAKGAKSSRNKFTKQDLPMDNYLRLRKGPF